MKKRKISLLLWVLLIIEVVVFVGLFCYLKNSATDSSSIDYEAGLQQGIETGQLYDTILLYVKNGSISTDELAEIDALRDMYYNNPTADNAIEWHNKMVEIVNSK